jgi:hypothetical protein
MFRDLELSFAESVSNAFLLLTSKMSVFICLGGQTKQIMVAKFQSLMLLIANAESSPLFWSGYFPLYVH